MTDAEIIEVVQAHKEGKQIQDKANYDDDTKFRTIDDPKWAFDVRDYRVKPEPRKPREWDVLISVDGKILESPRPTYDQTRQFYCKTIRVREVIEE